MSLLLYAVTEDAPCRDLPGAGLGGTPLRKLAHAGLAALVSDSPEAPEPSQEALLRYEQAIERLIAMAPLLPARFGTLIDNDAAVTRLLDERRAEFRMALERVRGAVELGLRAQWVGRRDDPSPAQPAAGTAYMQGRLAEQRRSRELAGEIQSTLVGVVRASMSRTLADSTTAFSASYLVDGAEVDEFLRRLEELERSNDDVTFVCTGPWPPYSFTGGEAR